MLPYNSLGNERSGNATFNRSTCIALTLDTSHSRVSSFAANPETAIELKVWDGYKVATLIAYEDWMFMSCTRGNSLLHPIPPAATAP